MPRRGKTKYAPLAGYLAAQPPAVQQVTLTFAAIEVLIGGPLPPSAWNTNFWNGGREVRQRWQAHGWRGTLNRATRTVTFVRR